MSTFLRSPFYFLHTYPSLNVFQPFFSSQDHSHLIIDEVHERSVDGDLLCLLARRLLVTCPDLRIILMSATVHTQLYKTYFTNLPNGEYYGNLDCLSVGCRRYELTRCDKISRLCVFFYIFVVKYILCTFNNSSSRDTYTYIG